MIQKNLADPRNNYLAYIIFCTSVWQTSHIFSNSSIYFRTFCFPSPLNVCSESSMSLNESNSLVAVALVPIAIALFSLFLSLSLLLLTLPYSSQFFSLFSSPSSSLPSPPFDFPTFPFFAGLFTLRVTVLNHSHNTALLPLTCRFNFLSSSFNSSIHLCSTFSLPWFHWW